ncbi:hypothetical protein [Leucobacter aridicollis]|uniref:Gram-positive cocci surface proteins LPxTG domain-containing protein n=1 Tax=Leucobacter aridicollis TaxID=283878 RepID=A0A852RLM8_9MICO|nr:hypothetical protein [Leucobacter aridicollis]MBL3681400.1 hypothetical protein [Leucobacter aridicollis]NYD27572.1 hypothetical protein [Leucobacter aridicollis]
MTRQRMLAALLAGGAAVAACGLAIGTPALAAPRAGGLTVTPARQLFNVTLHPGEQARALATVRNDAAEDLELALTPILTGESGDGAGASALVLSSERTTECSAAAMAGADEVTLAAAMPLSQGTIGSGDTIDLCVQVRYPEARAAGSAVSVVDLAFTGIERSPSTGGGLPGTGGGPSAALLLGAAGLVTAGAASLLRHPRRPTPAKEN